MNEIIKQEETKGELLGTVYQVQANVGNKTFDSLENALVYITDTLNREGGTKVVMLFRVNYFTGGAIKMKLLFQKGSLAIGTLESELEN